MKFTVPAVLDHCVRCDISELQLLIRCGQVASAKYSHRVLLIRFMTNLLEERTIFRQNILTHFMIMVFNVLKQILVTFFKADGSKLT